MITTEESKTWAKTIKARRINLAMTHDDLAQEVGIRTDRLVKLEKAHRSCSESEYRKVLTTLEENFHEKPIVRSAPSGFVGKPSKVPLTCKQALGTTDAEEKLAKKKAKIAIEIRTQRALKQVSYSEFAESLGSNVDQVSKLEHAHPSCTLQDLESALEIMKWF